MFSGSFELVGCCVEGIVGNEGYWKLVLLIRLCFEEVDESRMFQSGESFFVLNVSNYPIANQDQ
jgi:hypothetical protein